MARDHGRVFVQIWSDPDWIALSEGAQRAYILALTQPDLSYAGVLAPRYRRWSSLSSTSSLGRIRRAVRELEDCGFVMTDDATEEMWIRTFVKHDGILTFPNVTKAMVKAYRAIQSTPIRDAFVDELVDEFKRTGLLPDRPKGWDVVFKSPDEGGMCDVMDSYGVAA
jgi:hypothetical protein